MSNAIQERKRCNRLRIPWRNTIPFQELTGISLATWDLAPLSQHHCTKDILPMKIYPYLSYRREINETDVNYTYNLQKVWYSSASLNGLAAQINLYSIYNSNDQRRSVPRWNAITVRKWRGKGQFWGISYFWIKVLLNKEVLGLFPYEGTTFIHN